MDMVLSLWSRFPCAWMLIDRPSIAARLSAGLQGFDTFSASETETQPTVLSVRLLITVNHDNVRRRRSKS